MAKKKNIIIWIIAIIAIIYLVGQHDSFIISNPEWQISSIEFDSTELAAGERYTVTVNHEYLGDTGGIAKLECGFYPKELVESWGYSFWPVTSSPIGNCVYGEDNVATRQLRAETKIGTYEPSIQFQPYSTLGIWVPEDAAGKDYVLFCNIFEKCWDEVKDTTQDIIQHDYEIRNFKVLTQEQLSEEGCCEWGLGLRHEFMPISDCLAQVGGKIVDDSECDGGDSLTCSPTITTADLTEIQKKTSSQLNDWILANQCKGDLDCCDYPDSECIRFEEASTDWQKFWDWGDNNYGYCITSGSKYCAWAEGWAPEIFGQDQCASATILIFGGAVVFMFMLIIATGRR